MDSREEESTLVVGNLAVEAPRSHTRDDHIQSYGFLLVFLAYGTAQNLERSINTLRNMGTISLGILYVSFTLFSMVASMVVRALRSRNALILGTSGYWLFNAANLKPT